MAGAILSAFVGGVRYELRPALGRLDFSERWAVVVTDADAGLLVTRREFPDLAVAEKVFTETVAAARRCEEAPELTRSQNRMWS